MAMPKPQYNITALSSYGLKLNGQRWSQENFQRPSLSLDQRNNSLIINVYPNDPEEESKTIQRYGETKPMRNYAIECRMQWANWFKITRMFEEYLKQPESFEFEFSFKGRETEKSYGRDEKPPIVVVAKCKMGRDADGLCYMTFLQKGRRRCLFVFEDNYWIPVKVNGDDLTKAKDSEYEILAFFDHVKAIAGPNAVAYYVPQVSDEQPQQEETKATNSKPKPQAKPEPVVEDAEWDAM